MKAALKLFRVRKIEARGDEVMQGVQANLIVTQSSTIGIGSGENNRPHAKVDMKLNLIGDVAESKKEFLHIALDIEAVFEVLDQLNIPELQADSTLSKAFGDDCSRLIYPHAVLVLQRYLADFGVVSAQLGLEFPASPTTETVAANEK